jgi:hypothetical protein
MTWKILLKLGQSRIHACVSATQIDRFVETFDQIDELAGRFWSLSLHASNSQSAADSSLSRQRMNFEESNASIFACCSKSIRSEFLLVGKQPLMHRPEFPCSTVPKIDHHRARGHASPTKKADFPGIAMNKRGLIVKWGLFS